MTLPGFVGGTLDRADRVRNDPALIAEAFAEPSARVVALDGLDPLVDGASLATGPVPPHADVEDFLLLGVGDNGPMFVALDAAQGNGAAFAPKVWSLASLLTPDQLALYGT
ncbi:MAG: NADH pyrophosphatase, partial [Sphingobium sp.]